jgi:DNA-binding transcriptional LysR family regulator
VRVSAVSPLVRAYLAPQLPAFHRRYPAVVLELEGAEQVVDLVAGRFDVGVRVGPLQDAAFVARPLGPLQVVCCAAPAWLQAQRQLGHAALLQDPAAVALQHGLGLKPAGFSAAAPWRLHGPEGMASLPVAGPLVSNDFVTLVAACRAGLGVAQLPLVAVLPELQRRELVVLWPERSPPGLQLFLHYPSRELPARVRVFVEFVREVALQHADLQLKPAAFAEGEAARLPCDSGPGVRTAPRRRGVVAAKGVA